MKVDYIIVGQGVGGSSLAHHLLEAGKKVLVINHTDANSSSRVAAGIVNPITGRNMVKTWKADDIFPYLFQFYKKMETLLGVNVLEELPIYRPFVNMEEQNEWMGKSSEDSYKAYVKNINFDNESKPGLKSKAGGLELNYSGYVALESYLDAYKEYLKSKESYLEDWFDTDALKLSDEGVVYKSIEAARLIFCDGVQSRIKGYFDWLPFRRVKGELIYIKTDLNIQNIYNRGVFILPQKDGICKVGATYEWQDLSLVPTDKAKAQLVEKLEAIIDFDYEIVDHKVGIRPSTLDRRPFIGKHPKFQQLFIFNGLGTKGVSIAPFLAQNFTKYLENEQNIDREVNIERYFSLYYNG
ncbi:NAD(P)/FAD-dependent oxidoreductase [Aureibacter tunicatorum]|uniref:Glycine/D-amino acid oxidase-like deaminating enzyme n=1 Tax=Aureibacter tunicatorum TaxID=866807 RepID=A0AAE4BQ60_9BACT|nr:FAD-dependent oxidoreductase [Aureibacter tunicatorum]MDR6237221.1 glycine/D-amino acid oxidase-like deaminating enzyme [Aureibacter tunicatorum]BDD06213.1 FAD-dependent oxidoreductase [Aureibacter tunicatorum]